jgi:hypothetical protein
MIEAFILMERLRTRLRMKARKREGTGGIGISKVHPKMDSESVYWMVTQT